MMQLYHFSTNKMPKSLQVKHSNNEVKILSVENAAAFNQVIASLTIYGASNFFQAPLEFILH